MIDATKLGGLIAQLAPQFTYIKVGVDKNVFGDLWSIQCAKMQGNRVLTVGHAFTELQLNDIQDVGVVADAIVEQLRRELAEGKK